MWSRSKALQRVKAVREALLPGMWLTSWTEDRAPKKDAEATSGRGKKQAAAPAEGATVVVRGWADVLKKAEAEYASRNGGKRSTAAEIVLEKLKQRNVVQVNDALKIVAQKEVKGSLIEFALHMEFAGAPAPAEDKAANAKK